MSIMLPRKLGERASAAGMSINLVWLGMRSTRATPAASSAASGTVSSAGVRSNPAIQLLQLKMPNDQASRYVVADRLIGMATDGEGGARQKKAAHR